MNRYKNDHDVPFEVFVASSNEFEKGRLKGTWVRMPTSNDELKCKLKDLNIYNNEWFIADYDVYVDEVYEIISEEKDFDKLNRFATCIENMSDEVFYEYCSNIEDMTSMKQLIHLAEVIG